MIVKKEPNVGLYYLSGYHFWKWNNWLHFFYGAFLLLFIADALMNLNLATAMWQIGYEPFPTWHTIWERWSYAERYAFYLEPHR